MALLIHGEAASNDRTSFQKLVASITHDYPHLLGGMLPTSGNEVRKILREKGIRKPSGLAFRDMPIVKLDPNFWQSHFEMFSRKLMLALHYRVFGRPLSNSGAIWAFQFSNVDAAMGKLPKEFLDITDQLVLPARANQILADQFSVRWSGVPEHTTAVFFAQFHDRLVVSGVTTEDLNAFPMDGKPKPLHPFRWAL